MALSVWDIAAVLLKALTYGGSLTAAGAVLFVLLFRRLLADAPTPAAEFSLILIRRCAAVGLAATLLQPLLKTALLSGAGLAGAFDWPLLQLILGSGEGTSAALRLVGLALLILPLSQAGVRLFAATLICLSFAFTGHTAQHSPWLMALLVLHLVAVAFWIGALPLLLRLCSLLQQRPLAAIMAAFGRYALYGVGVLILAGLIIAWLLLGELRNLWLTDYGRWLLLKLILVALLLALAASNKLRWVPCLVRNAEPGAVPLARSIRAEIVIAALILVVTATFTSLSGAPIYQ